MAYATTDTTTSLAIYIFPRLEIAYKSYVQNKFPVEFPGLPIVLNHFSGLSTYRDARKYKLKRVFLT